MSERKHNRRDHDVGAIKGVSQSSNGDNNVQIVGNDNVVSVTTPPIRPDKRPTSVKTTIRQNWIKIILAVIAIVVSIYFGISNNRDSRSEPRNAIKQSATTSDTVRSENRKAITPSGGAKMGSFSDSSKQTKITQIAHGDKNVQIVGHGNVVDNSTHISQVAPNSKLSYIWTGVKCSEDGHYIGAITIKSTGAIPVYHPKLYVRLDRGVQKIDRNVEGGALSNVIESRSSDNSEYLFTTQELAPDVQLRISLVNDGPFNVAEFKINDEWCFGDDAQKRAGN